MSGTEKAWTRLPVIHQLRQSVGLQRGMLVAGLIITGLFVLVAIFAPLLAPYGFSQIRPTARCSARNVLPVASTCSARRWGATTCSPG